MLLADFTREKTDREAAIVMRVMYDDKNPSEKEVC